MGFGGESSAAYRDDESMPQHATQASDAYQSVLRHATSRQGHMHQILNQGIDSFPARTSEQMEAARSRFPHAFSQASSANGVLPIKLFGCLG
jgi:hypothetical protein